MPDLQNLLDIAFTHHQAGDLAEASRIYKEILRGNPLQPDALHMLGVIAKQQGNNQLALKLIEVALGQRTTMPLAWHNRSLLLRLTGKKDEALQSAQQAVDLDPSFAEAWDVIGVLLRDKRKLDESRAAHAKAVALCPDNLKFLGNYALLLLATGEWVEAYRVMRKVEQRDPAILPHTMGNILKAMGYPDRALTYYQRSAAAMPDDTEILTTKSMAHLQVGDFAEGWKLWEKRADLDVRFQHIPIWQGQPVEHLLLHEDQGMGDTIQCARYIPELQKYAKRITLQITVPLQRLFAATLTTIDIITLNHPVPAADARIRLLSLPALFKSDATNIPNTVPYLFACEQWRKVWQERLTAIPRPRIGLVWGGNPDHLNDRQRSIPFSVLQPILAAGAGHVVSLQKGAQKNGADLAAIGIFDADHFLNDFTDTAGLMAELDLIITVDTSIAHLAGALGKPVWLMLPFDPDWRWLLGREDSPWYPTMRLFRQNQPRNWPEIITRVESELRRYLAGDSSVLQPTAWQCKNLRHNPHAISLPETSGT